MRVHEAIFGTALDLIVNLRSRKSLRREPKYFVLSLHRSGTRSTSELLQGFGIRTVHWPISHNGRKKLQRKIIGHEDDLDFVVDVIEPVINRHDAVSDVPIPTLYRQLDQRYPNARFILVRRNVGDWIRSVRKHAGSRPFDPYECVQYWHYFPARPTKIEELSDAELTDMFDRHVSDVTQYFTKDKKEKLGIFDLENRETGSQIAAFLGRNIEATFPHIMDVKKPISKT
jgi:hypothetical protein